MRMASLNRSGWWMPWLLALNCCGAQAEDGGQLAGREFLLDSAQGFEPVAGSTLSLKFKSGEVRFDAGCNLLNGSYSVSGGRLVVTHVGSTSMGCGPELGAQEDWFQAFMTSSPQMDLAGDFLTLTGAVATLVFLDREVADPDRPLAGPTWRIDTIFDNGMASGVFSDPARTLVFHQSGGVTVSAGCSSGGGAYVVQGAQIVLSGMAYSDEGCAGALPATDAQVQAVLSDGALSYEIDAARLRIQRGSTGIGAVTD
ncbi:MAG: META domain-containing protein [Myxococcales bacterium]|nr:META domain-containing protein [Myxococcales bacterium]